MPIDKTVDQTAPITLDGVPSSAQLRADLVAEGQPVLLAFSRGKDSIAAWLALREAGVQVIPFHLYLVPGLRWVEDSVREFEDYFQTRIERLPHPTLYRWLNHFVFQPPERCAVIDAAQLPEPDYQAISWLVAQKHGLDPAKTWTADGVRAADSPNRRTSMKTHGPRKPSVRKVAVVWDWRIRHVREAIKTAKAPMPPDYDWFGRSFDGLDYRFLDPIRRNAPDDYQRILDWFPLADLEIFRHGL